MMNWALRDETAHVSCFEARGRSCQGIKDGISPSTQDMSPNPPLMYAIHKTEKAAWSNRETVLYVHHNNPVLHIIYLKIWWRRCKVRALTDGFVRFKRDFTVRRGCIRHRSQRFSHTAGPTKLAPGSAHPFLDHLISKHRSHLSTLS